MIARRCASSRIKVESELRVCEEVRIPVAAAWGSPCDVHLPLDMVEPYFDATWLSSCAALGRDIDHATLFQSLLYLRIHTSSPLVMASDTEVIQDTTL